MNFNKNIPYLIVIAILLIWLNRQCEKEPEIIVKTVTKTVIVKDTITETIIKEVPKTVYVERIKTVKGKDSIIYLDKPSDGSITANQFDATVKANDATAQLKITTTGQLIDVLGTIDYPRTKTTTTIIKNRDKSGLYIYGSTTIQNIQPELGLLYQFKNKAFISSSAQYNDFTNSIDGKIGIGVKVF